MSSASANPAPRAVLWFLVTTAFLGSMGIGLVNPVVPYLAERLVPTGDLALLVSALSMSYAGAAFLAAPALGALSDRFGRRPVLILSMLGGGLLYARAHRAAPFALGVVLLVCTAALFARTKRPAEIALR